ncbi:MAG TPA: hypothetical protein VGF94_25315 [Kofleriaceae bacterium]|jgi:lipid-binding SYLF domain-containing protein
MTKLLLAAAAALAVSGCATKPAQIDDQNNLEHASNVVLGAMRAHYTNLDDALQGAYAFAMFPEVGEGGVVTGAAFGRGVLYEHGRPSGFVKLEQAAFSDNIGDRTFAELLVLRDQDEVDRLKRGELDLGQATRVVILGKHQLPTDQLRGATVMLMPRGGALLEASAAGQRIQFSPRG